MKSINVKLLPISKIKNHFDSRIFAVPQLQREFVWNSRKACDLLDSIYNNYPIGNIMVWDSAKDKENEFRHDYISLPLYDNVHNKRIYLIIDGQQRLSTLFHSFEGDTIQNSYRKDIDFGNIYFNLDKGSESRFRYVKYSDPEWEVKLSDVLSSTWRSKFKNYPKYKFNEVEKCRDKILDYKIPFTFIQTQELEEIQTTFIRINSGGTPLSSADRAIALATSLDLRHNINAVINQLQYGFNKINRLSLIMTIALIWGSKQVGKKGIESVIKEIENDEENVEYYKEIWSDLKNSYGTAIDYIVKNFNVLNFDFLPSQTMITTLSCFFYYNGNKQPTPYQRDQIRKWFWYTSVGSRYSGRGYSKNILEDHEFFKRLGEKGTARLKVSELISVNDIRYADYSKKGSLSNGYFCSLASLGPKYLSTGGDVPVDNFSVRSNQRNKHHIFPRAHLRNKGFNKKYYNSIANICFLVWKENIDISASPPRKYLTEFRQKKYFPAVMRSHMIPYKNGFGLWNTDTKKGYKTFMNQRTKLICQRFEKLAGAKLFERTN